MKAKGRKTASWMLYALLFLSTMLLQTVVLGTFTVFGVKLALVPVCLSCICMMLGAESGALFALLASSFFKLSGGGDGSIILTMTLCGALAGYFCDLVATRHILSALVMCLVTLLVVGGVSFFGQVYFGALPGTAVFRMLILPALISLPFCPIAYDLARRIRRRGI